MVKFTLNVLNLYDKSLDSPDLTCFFNPWAVTGWRGLLTRQGGTYLRHVGSRVRDSSVRDESREDLAIDKSRTCLGDRIQEAILPCCHQMYLFDGRRASVSYIGRSQRPLSHPFSNPDLS